MRRRGRWWLLVPLLVLYAVSAIFFTKPNTQQSAVDGDSTSVSQNGSYAMAQLWQTLRLGWSTWSEIPAFLPDNSKADFVSVEPMDGTWSDADASALLAWVKQGHNAVVVTDQNTPVMDALGLTIDPMEDTPVSTVQVQRRGVATPAAMTGLQMTAQAALEDGGLGAALALYRDRQGDTLGATLPIGAGRITVWTVPSVWENGGVGQKQNLRLVWDIVGNKSILWDEFGHGQNQTPAFGGWFRGTGLAALVLLILTALLYLWRTSRRFGTPARALDERPKVNAEFLRTLSIYLKRPALRSWQHELVSNEILSRLQSRYGVADWGGTAAAAALPPGVRERYLQWRALHADGYQRGTWRLFLNASQDLLRVLEPERSRKENQYA